MDNRAGVHHLEKSVEQLLPYNTVLRVEARSDFDYCIAHFVDKALL